MRVTSELFVSSLLHRAFAQGGFAAVLHKGAAEAGAVFVVARGRQGETSLYGPAPQTSYGEGRPDDRYFTTLAEDADEATIAQRLERERRFDPDVWVVELEIDGGVGELIELKKP